MFPHGPQHRSTRSASLVAATAAMIILLAGCTPAADRGSASGDDETHELRIATVTPPNSLDPAQLSDGPQAFVWSSVLDTLLVRVNGTGELAPNAAESWEYNEDGTELTLKLRDDMTFSDGDPVTAEAVAATMLRSKATPGLLQPRLTAVEDVTAPDDTTVVISFSHFDPEFLDQLALAAGAIGDPDTLDEGRTTTDPIGSGPYTLDVDATVPGTSYTLRKRADHWNADAFPFDTVTTTVLQEPTAALNALQAGQINAGTLAPQLAGQVDPSTFTTKKTQAQAVALLVITDKTGEQFPALGDIRVRQALNYAIDRKGIVSSILQNNATPTEQVFSPLHDVYDESINGKYEYDPEKGRELIEEAGFVGTTFRIPSTFLTSAFEAILSQAFSDIGLAIEWVPTPPQQVDSVFASGEYGLVFQVLGYTSDASQAGNVYDVDGTYNPRAYSDPILEDIFDTLGTTVDIDGRLPAYRELNEHAVDQALNVPIVNVSTNWVTSEGVEMLDDGSSGIQSVRLFGLSK
jgi:peptide/nickel transport system substrate-binding protein